MKNLTVVTARRADIQLTAEQWQLYTSTHPEECEIAAERINRAIELNFNQGLSREDVEHAAEITMAKFRNFGAADTEPIHVLQDVLDALFGEEE